MKVQCLFIAAGVNTAHDELDALVVNRTLQRNALAGSKTVELHELLSNDRSLPVVDERLPVGVRHLELRNHVSKLACIHRKVRKKVSLVFIDTTEPTERH